MNVHFFFFPVFGDISIFKTIINFVLFLTLLLKKKKKSEQP